MSEDVWERLERVYGEMLALRAEREIKEQAARPVSAVEWREFLASHPELTVDEGGRDG